MKRRNWHKYTFQTISECGSFAAPQGDDVHHASSLEVLRSHLETWREEHDRVGSDCEAASLLVWKGDLDDVTDQYPDFEMRLGPRNGAVIIPC